MTPETLARCMAIPYSRAQRWADPLTEAFRIFEIDSSDRQAAFLGEVGVESGLLVFTREIWGNPPTNWQRTYASRSDLGNTLPQAVAFAKAAGDNTGHFYRGVGLLQVTGYANILRASMTLFGDDRGVREPRLLEEPSNAARSAAHFWQSHGLNELADDESRFDRITRIINGSGMLHAAERRKLRDQVRAHLP